MEANFKKFTPSQIDLMDTFLKSESNKIIRCPNNHKVHNLETSETGIVCLKCDYKVPIEKIPIDIVSEVE
jgi:hypothetical protein